MFIFLQLFSYFLVHLSACVVSICILNFSLFISSPFFLALCSPFLPAMVSHHAMFAPNAVQLPNPLSVYLIKLLLLRAPLRTHLLSHEQIKLSVTIFKEFLSSPPLLTTLVNLLFSHILHLQQHLSSQRFLCWLLNSLLSCTPSSSVELQHHTLVFLFIFNFLIRQHVHLCQQTADCFGPSYKDFSPSL